MAGQNKAGSLDDRAPALDPTLPARLLPGPSLGRPGALS